MQPRYALHRQCIGVHCLYDVRSLVGGAEGAARCPLSDLSDYGAIGGPQPRARVKETAQRHGNQSPGVGAGLARHKCPLAFRSTARHRFRPGRLGRDAGRARVTFASVALGWRIIFN